MWKMWKHLTNVQNVWQTYKMFDKCTKCTKWWKCCAHRTRYRMWKMFEKYKMLYSQDQIPMFEFFTNTKNVHRTRYRWWKETLCLRLPNLSTITGSNTKPPLNHHHHHLLIIIILIIIQIIIHISIIINMLVGIDWYLFRGHNHHHGLPEKSNHGGPGILNKKYWC